MKIIFFFFPSRNSPLKNSNRIFLSRTFSFFLSKHILLKNTLESLSLELRFVSRNIIYLISTKISIKISRNINSIPFLFSLSLFEPRSQSALYIKRGWFLACTRRKTREKGEGQRDDAGRTSRLFSCVRRVKPASIDPRWIISRPIPWPRALRSEQSDHSCTSVLFRMHLSFRAPLTKKSRIQDVIYRWLKREGKIKARYLKIQDRALWLVPPAKKKKRWDFKFLFSPWTIIIDGFIFYPCLVAVASRRWSKSC